MLDALDAAAVQRWSRIAVELLAAHRAQLDALNVFPVADSDTGANMLTTLRAADAALSRAGEQRPAGALSAWAAGAAEGALGNSGFIVSQILAGIAEAAAQAEDSPRADDAGIGGRREALAPAASTPAASTPAASTPAASTPAASTPAASTPAASTPAASTPAASTPAASTPAASTLAGLPAAALAAGLDRGASLARAAVVTPVDGTMLTVARAAADGAAKAAADSTGPVSGGSAGGRDGDLVAIVRAAVAEADRALQHTPEQLPELAQAGVVDAGGRALVLVLDALVRVVTGSPAPLAAVRAPLRSVEVVPWQAGAPTFEVQYALAADSPALDGLKQRLAEIGDSIAVVPTGAGSWKVHVHVDDVGAAIEAGVVAGRPHDISVVSLQPPDSHDSGPSAVLAVAPGAGLTHLFESEGVHVVAGGAEDVPSVDDVFAAMRATGARDVVLLPNASRVAGLAESAATLGRAEGLRTWVVPTRSPVQGLAAIAVHDAARRVEDDVVAMAEAAAATRFAELIVARSAALTAVGICQPGDVLGLIDGDVVEIGANLQDVALAVVDRLLGVGGELMTVLVGADAAPELGGLIDRHVRARAPFTDVTVYAGGQADTPLIFGVE